MQEQVENEPEILNWDCPVCTLQNSIYDLNCQVCESPQVIPKKEIVKEYIQDKFNIQKIKNKFVDYLNLVLSETKEVQYEIISKSSDSFYQNLFDYYKDSQEFKDILVKYQLDITLEPINIFNKLFKKHNIDILLNDPNDIQIIKIQEMAQIYNNYQNQFTFENNPNELNLNDLNRKFIFINNLFDGDQIALLKFLVQFNNEINNTIHLINFSSQNYLSNNIKNLRLLINPQIVDSLKEFILDNTSFYQQQQLKVEINRIQLKKDCVENSVFFKCYEQLKDVDSIQLRPQKPQGSDPFICFQVKLVGENVMGESGPYRQLFTDISKELNGLYFDFLLSKVPNNINQITEYRDSFTINSNLIDIQSLQYFQFFGKLMGCIFRTNQTQFSINLNDIIWKLICNQNIILEDVYKYDVGLFKKLQYIKEINDMQNLIEIVKEEFEIQNDFENMNIKQIKEHCIQHEIDNQIIIPIKSQVQMIQQGFFEIIPKNLLNLLNYESIKLKIQGKQQIDFNLLKRHTYYSQDLSEDHELIKNFWETVMSFTNEEAIKFIKFCWAQERLPIDDIDFEKNQIRYYIKSMTKQYDNYDLVLPKADTCFFNFELPRYSTKEIMKNKILQAINLDCDAIDADNVQIINQQQDEQEEYISEEDYNSE